MPKKSFADSRQSGSARRSAQRTNSGFLRKPTGASVPCWRLLPPSPRSFDSPPNFRKTRLAKLQGVLRSTVGRSVPELARLAVLLADDMPAAIQAGTPLFERILVLAEGASIVAELDWYCVKEACDLLILLEALADSIEDQLEDEHLLKHIVFRHLRIALDRAFDLDAVLPDEDDEDGYYYWYGDADEDEEEKEDDESEDFGEDDDAGSRLRATNLSSPS